MIPTDYEDVLKNLGNTAQESAEHLAKVTGAIKDSGERQQFETGAVRDIQKGKGRCDLMPLRVVAKVFNHFRDHLKEDGGVMNCIAAFQETGKTVHLLNALDEFDGFDGSWSTMFLEVAKHFEEGAEKYGENNWQKGLPPHCYINSAVRHYLKWRRGDKDEPHDRAFVWNLMCCIWEVEYSPRAKGREVQLGSNFSGMFVYDGETYVKPDHNNGAGVQVLRVYDGKHVCFPDEIMVKPLTIVKEEDSDE